MKYGKSIPSRLERMYQEGFENPDITGHRDEIALLEARLDDILAQSDEGGSAELWREARKLFSEHERVASFNPELANSYFIQLGDVIEKGNHEIGAWEQAIKVIEQRRKLTTSHHAQLVQASQLVPIGKVLEMLAEIANVVQNKVEDPRVIQAILNAISEQMDGGVIEGEVVPERVLVELNE